MPAATRYPHSPDSQGLNAYHNMLICGTFYGSDGTRTRDLRRDRPAFRLLPFVCNGRALSYWRTGCGLLGKVLGEPTRRLGKRLVKLNSGQASAEIAARRSPVRVRLALAPFARRSPCPLRGHMTTSSGISR
jgi:hypothetical protein